MAATLDAVVFDAHDPDRLARFWATALGWERRSDGAVAPPIDTDVVLAFVAADAPGRPGPKNPIHLDLTTSSAEHRRALLDRLLASGASPADVGQGADATHVVLADPEGNELCVIEPENRFLAGRGPLGSITCDGSPAAGRFWAAALGWDLFWDQNGETAIRRPDGTGPYVTWGPPVPARPVESRVRLRLRGATPAELVALGAVDLGEGRLADPDGTVFELRAGSQD